MESLSNILEDCIGRYREISSEKDKKLQYLLKTLGPLFANPDSDIYKQDGIEYFIDFTKNILRGKLSYEEYIQHIKDDLPAHQRCHCVFGTDNIIYRCVDCSTGDSSCLCQECFEAGNHEGHNFKRYTSSCGGCCDCGDIESWKREGWCKKHLNAKYVPNADQCMVEDQRLDAEIIFTFLFLLITSLFNTFDCDYKMNLFNSLINFIKNWGDINQSTIRLVGKCLQHQFNRNELIEYLSYFNYTLPNSILSNSQYETVDLCRVMIRSITLHRNPDAFTFLVLTLILDISFRDWFIEVYLDELSNLLLDTLQVLTTDKNGNSIEDAVKAYNNKRENLSNAKRSFVELLARNYIQRVLSDNGMINEDDENFEIPDDVNIQHLYAQVIRHYMESDELSEITGESASPYRECTGYDQFVQSIHCQFFHSESSFYSHPKFKNFLRDYFHTCSVIVNKVVQLFGRETLFFEMPTHLIKFAFHTLNCISTITDDASDSLAAAFDNMEVDGELIYVPCPELIELLNAFQGLGLVEWKSELMEQEKMNEYMYLITVIQNINSTFYQYYDNLFSHYNDKQRVLLISHSILAIANSLQHPISDDYYLSVYHNTKNCMNYQLGRYLLHWIDFFVVDILSLIVKYHLIQPFTQQLTMQHKSLLHMVLSNSIRILACDDYFFSLGAVRFTQLQSLTVTYDRVYNMSPPTNEFCCLCINLAILFLSPEEVISTIFDTFTKDVAVQLDDNKEEQSVGIHLMLCYFIFLIVNQVYDFSLIDHDLKKYLQEDMKLTLLQEEDLALDSIAYKSGYIRDIGSNRYLVDEITTSHFDSDTMEIVYRIKKECLENLNIFAGCRDLHVIATRMEYIKENLKLKTYTVPQLPTDPDLLLIIHRLLGNPFTITMIYHLLQRQYIFHNNDPKLMEALLYLIQVISQCHGDMIPDTEKYDLSPLREFLQYHVWNDTKLNCDNVDCCSLLWISLQHTPIIDDSHIEFKLPDNIVGMLSFLYHDSSFPSDLNTLLESTMKMCIRPDNDSDNIFVTLALRERESQKRESSNPVEEIQGAGKEAISNLNAKLDDFLSMYADEDDEEEEEENHQEMIEEKEKDTIFTTISSSFTCALCHGSETAGSRNTPLLLCHYDKSQVNTLDTYNGLFHEFTLDKTKPIQEQYRDYLDFLKIRSEDNTLMDTVNAIHTDEVCLSDCSIGSCLHMVHYSCYCDFIEGSNTFGKNHYQFCPVCRRLESGFFPLLCPITVNRSLRSTYLPQPLFNPDSIHPTQWNDLQKLNELSILSYYDNLWENKKLENNQISSDYGVPETYDFFIKNIHLIREDKDFKISKNNLAMKKYVQSYNPVPATIYQMEIATRQLSPDLDISFYPFVTRFDQNRTILESHAIQTLQQIFLTNAGFCLNHIIDDYKTNSILYNTNWMNLYCIPNTISESDYMNEEIFQETHLFGKQTSIIKKNEPINEIDILLRKIFYIESCFYAFNKEDNENNHSVVHYHYRGLDDYSHSESSENENESENIRIPDLMTLDDEELDLFFRQLNEDLSNIVRRESESVENQKEVPTNQYLPLIFANLHEVQLGEETNGNIFLNNMKYITQIVDEMKEKESYQIDESKFELMKEEISILALLYDSQQQDIDHNDQQQFQVKYEILQCEYTLFIYFIQAFSHSIVNTVPEIFNPSRMLLKNQAPFSLLMNQLLNTPPISLPHEQYSLFDRYLITTLSLIPQYYILTLQQACFTITALLNKNSLSLVDCADYDTLKQYSTLLSFLESFSSSLAPLQLHCSYAKQLLSTLQTKGIIETIKQLSIVYLRQCVILLYVLNDSSNESTYILPSDYQELIQYLNLPSFDKLDSFIQNHLEIQLFSNVTLNNILAFFTLLKTTQSIEGPSCILTHSLLESSIIMPLPEDLRVLNYFCHRFHESSFFCTQCQQCCSCNQLADIPFLCLSCGRTYCSEKSGITRCHHSRNKKSVCRCNALINTSKSAINVVYNSTCFYPFGSVYYTVNGTTNIVDWPREQLLLNKKAKDILEAVVKNSTVWYKTNMSKKCFLIRNSDDDD